MTHSRAKKVFIFRRNKIQNCGACKITWHTTINSYLYFYWKYMQTTSQDSFERSSSQHHVIVASWWFYHSEIYDSNLQLLGIMTPFPPLYNLRGSSFHKVLWQERHESFRISNVYASWTDQCKQSLKLHVEHSMRTYQTIEIKIWSLDVSRHIDYLY